MLSKTKIAKICRFFPLALLLSCEPADRFEIPGVYVDFSINIINDVEYFALQSPGNSQEISGRSVGFSTLGYDNNGIIIFNNGGEFYAFDRTCPYDFPTSIAVDSDGGGSATCPECNSTYLFSAIGSPVAGSLSKHPLKQYKTSPLTSSGWLRVYN